MPSDRAYQYSAIDMKVVMETPEEYIIPENLEACRLLWSKNIFTVMCNNYDNDESWITINSLSAENQRIFDEMAAIDPRFGPTWGGIGLRIPIKPRVGNDTYEAFRELIDLFQVQDVQKDGCMTVETFMTYYTDCYAVVYNDEYLSAVKKMMSADGDVIIYDRDFERSLREEGIRRKIRIFDETKMTMSIEEYVAESKFAGFYDESENKIYYNDMYYQAHLKYMKQHKVSKKLN